MSVYYACLSLLLAQLCALGAARSAGSNEFRSDYTYWPEAEGWLKLHRVPLDWHTARVQCYHEGAVLASPLNAGLQMAITKILGQSEISPPYVFSGVSATLSDGLFSSVEGIPIEQLIIKWPTDYEGHPGQHEDKKKQCLVYDSRASPMWYYSCEQPLPYFCYRKLSVTDELTDCGTVDRDYKLDARTGHCYKFHRHGRTWTRAARVCQAEGGYLAVIDSQPEADLLSELFAAHPTLLYTAYQNSAAVGFKKWGNDNSWWTIHEWSSGIEFRSDYTFSQKAAGWLKLHRVPLDWHTARVQCYHEGAVLASPLNADLWSALTRVLMKANLDSKLFYSGVSATFNDGVYSSVEGVPLEQLFIQWGKNQPNRRDLNEQCLLYYKESQKVTIYDKNCTRLLPYICYRPGSTPDNIVTECGTVDKEYRLDARTGHCYKYYGEAHALPWTVAARVCRAEGGYLADINSQYEAQLLVNMVLTKTKPIKPTMAMIGFRTWGDKSWWTIHGKRLDENGYALWQDGEPNDFGESEQCGSILLANGTLNDVSCRVPHAFICEKHPDSLLHLKYDECVN